MRTVCSDYRVDLPQITNGIRLNRFSARLHVFPNPSSDGQVVLQGVPANVQWIDVFSLTGTRICTVVLQRGGICSLDELSSGVYFLQPRGMSGMARLIKQ
jgi:hypothetical protein